MLPVTSHDVSLNSFDSLAPYYDRLARLVFGRAIRSAQLIHLPHLSKAKSVLILGGGTGWILPHLLRASAVAHVTYIEASARMIALSRNSIPENARDRITFVHGTEDTLQPGNCFDAVIINFFADMFTDPELVGLVRQLKKLVNNDGYILCTDFVNDRWWQRAMLKAMYLFFRLTTKLDTRQLAPWRSIITAGGFQRLQSQTFWRRFIWSELYQKTS